MIHFLLFISLISYFNKLFFHQHGMTLFDFTTVEVTTSLLDSNVSVINNVDGSVLIIPICVVFLL